MVRTVGPVGERLSGEREAPLESSGTVNTEGYHTYSTVASYLGTAIAGIVLWAWRLGARVPGCYGTVRTSAHCFASVSTHWLVPP